MATMYAGNGLDGGPMLTVVRVMELYWEQFSEDPDLQLGVFSRCMHHGVCSVDPESGEMFVNNRLGGGDRATGAVGHVAPGECRAYEWYIPSLGVWRCRHWNTKEIQTWVRPPVPREGGERWAV